MNDAILSIRGLRKTYGTGVDALKSVDLDIRRGEIFALLGPNGAGKTTLINIVCGIVTATGGRVLVGGHDHAVDYKGARVAVIGQVILAVDQHGSARWSDNAADDVDQRRLARAIGA